MVIYVEGGISLVEDNSCPRCNCGWLLADFDRPGLRCSKCRMTILEALPDPPPEKPGDKDALGHLILRRDIARMRRRYHSSPGKKAQLLAEQGEKCAICGLHRLVFKGAPVMDHDHTTLKVRGVICRNCNLMLGHAHDSTEVLQKAIEYLESQKDD